MAKGQAGITNNNRLKISRCFLAAKKGDGLFQSSPAPQKNHRHLPLASGDSMLRYCQNVAGMWLKYGAKVSGAELSAVQESLRSCDDLLTSTVDNADGAGL